MVIKLLVVFDGSGALNEAKKINNWRHAASCRSFLVDLAACIAIISAYTIHTWYVLSMYLVCIGNEVQMHALVCIICIGMYCKYLHVLCIDMY